jgi:hypothetical protein
MKISYSYKSDREEECPYNISCDRECVELLEGYALIQLRQAIYKTDEEPDPEKIKQAHETYQHFVELLKE